MIRRGPELLVTMMLLMMPLSADLKTGHRQQKAATTMAGRGRKRKRKARATEREQGEEKGKEPAPREK